MNIFSMGGYAPYVWTAYGITFFVFGMNLFSAFREKKFVKKLLKQQFLVNHHES